MYRRLVVAFVATLWLAAGAARAQLIPVDVFADANGHGTYTNVLATFSLGWTLAPDPGPGGLPSVLTYTNTAFPLDALQGDVLVIDPDLAGLPVEVIRFNGDNTLLYYSSDLDGSHDLADTSSPPEDLYTNLAVITQGRAYRPGSGDPGSLASLGFQVTYRFGPITATAVPEPGAAGLVLGCLCGLSVLLTGREGRQRLVARGPMRCSSARSRGR